MTTEQDTDHKTIQHGRRGKNAGFVTFGLMIVLVLSGVGGILTLAVRRVRSNDDEAAGSNHLRSAPCPDTALGLGPDGRILDDDLAVVAATEPQTNVRLPSCLDADDPQRDGRYYDFVVPTDGHVTVAAWTIAVDPSTCACRGLSSSTVAVQKGEILRLWATHDEFREMTKTLLRFDPQGPLSLEDACPSHALLLQADGTVDATTLAVQGSVELASKDIIMYLPPCVNQQDPLDGRYYDFVAPTDGSVTVQSFGILVDPITCECAVDAHVVSTVAVVAGQPVRVWAPRDKMRPLLFTSH